MDRVIQNGPTDTFATTTAAAKGKGSPYSTAERRVPQLIPVLGSQPAPAGGMSRKPGGRLPLLSAPGAQLVSAAAAAAAAAKKTYSLEERRRGDLLSLQATDPVPHAEFSGRAMPDPRLPSRTAAGVVRGRGVVRGGRAVERGSRGGDETTREAAGAGRRLGAAAAARAGEHGGERGAELAAHAAVDEEVDRVAEHDREVDEQRRRVGDAVGHQRPMPRVLDD